MVFRQVLWDYLESPNFCLVCHGLTWSASLIALCLRSFAGPTWPHASQFVRNKQLAILPRGPAARRAPLRSARWAAGPRGRMARCLFRTKVFEVMRPGGARKGAPAPQRPRGRLVRLPGGGIVLLDVLQTMWLPMTHQTEIRAFRLFHPKAATSWQWRVPTILW